MEKVMVFVWKDFHMGAIVFAPGTTKEQVRLMFTGRAKRGEQYLWGEGYCINQLYRQGVNTPILIGAFGPQKVITIRK